MRLNVSSREDVENLEREGLCVELEEDLPPGLCVPAIFKDDELVIEGGLSEAVDVMVGEDDCDLVPNHCVED